MKIAFVMIAATLLGGCSSLNQYMWDVQEPVFNPVHVPVTVWVDATAEGDNWSVKF